MRTLVLACFGLATAGAANAEDLTVQVRDQRGAPVPDAVVTYHPDLDAQAAPPTPATVEIAQRDLAFDPFVTVAPVGSQAVFTNDDAVLHHVFSFSPTKRFDLRLFGRDAPQTVDFDRAGTVAVGCNIHDNMIAYLRIVETPYAVRTAEEGAAALADVPAGSGVLRVWHPDLRAKDNQVAQEITVGPDGARVDVAIEVRAQRARRSRY